MADFETTSKNAAKKEQAADKLKSSATPIKHDKVTSALAELSEAQQQQSDGKVHLSKISETMQNKEIPWFAECNEKEWRKFIKEYVGEQLEAERKMLQDWEDAYNEVSKIEDETNIQGLAEKIAAEVL